MVYTWNWIFGVLEGGLASYTLVVFELPDTRDPPVSASQVAKPTSRDLIFKTYFCVCDVISVSKTLFFLPSELQPQLKGKKM